MTAERTDRIQVEEWPSKGDDIDKVQGRFRGRPDVEVVVHPCAGHAFENSFHPLFANPDATAGSWPHTPRFLARTLEG